MGRQQACTSLPKHFRVSSAWSSGVDKRFTWPWAIILVFHSSTLRWPSSALTMPQKPDAISSGLPKYFIRCETTRTKLMAKLFKSKLSVNFPFVHPSPTLCRAKARHQYQQHTGNTANTEYISKTFRPSSLLERANFWTFSFLWNSIAVLSEWKMTLGGRIKLCDEKFLPFRLWIVKTLSLFLFTFSCESWVIR